MYKIRYLAAFTIFIAANSNAECMGYIKEHKYEKVRILSCETTEKIMQEKADFGKYSPANKKELLQSSKNLILIEVLPLYELEYITSVYDGVRKEYLGKSTPISKKSKVKLHMQYSSCDSYPKDKEIVVSISSNYHCCREFEPVDFQETSAACLVKFERAVDSRLSK